jgi:hypothetical protein
MAIKIPSRNIYEKDNDKIRDNKIDRIEVGAFEILPNNEYDVSVANETITNMLTGSSYIDEGFTISYATKTNPNPESNADYQYFATLLVGYQNITAISKKIRIYVSKKQKQTSIISKLKKLVEDVTQDDGTKKTIPKINFSVVANKYIGKGQILAEIPDRFSEFHDDNVHVLERYERDFSNSTPTQTKVDIVELKIDINRTAGGKEFPIVTQNFGWICGEEIPARENGTISATITSEDENGYTIETEILCGAYLDNYYSGVTSGGYFQDEHPFELDQHLEGECIWYEPISIEFTLYGNTIGIDLQDKTIYVPNQEGSKPFSVEGNELMQVSKDNLVQIPFNTSNLELIEGKWEPGRQYYTVALKSGIQTDKKITANVTYSYGGHTREKQFVIYEGNSKSAEDDILAPFENLTISSATIEVDPLAYAFSKTQAHYAKGKETATIRCSISDYYDENGEKVIATNNSNKMAFDIYDEVIPYSYGADGSDKPLSRHKDGSPKTFVVLGTRIFYDGAVWQELTLQEK